MYIYVEANCFILHNACLISACCFFGCLESIGPSITNMFCAATETSAQGTNDTYKMGQAFVWTVSYY